MFTILFQRCTFVGGLLLFFFFLHSYRTEQIKTSLNRYKAPF